MNGVMTRQESMDEDKDARDHSGASKDATQKSAGAFRTISEVAEELDVQQHVLRFWETKFSQVRPLKRGGGRRYYRPEDVALLRAIHYLLYTEGFTIKGVQKLLREQGKNLIVTAIVDDKPVAGPKLAAQAGQTAQTQEGNAPATPAPDSAARQLTPEQRSVLEVMLGELKAMRALLPVE